jgi:hypothetical protein
MSVKEEGYGRFKGSMGRVSTGPFLFLSPTGKRNRVDLTLGVEHHRQMLSVYGTSGWCDISRLRDPVVQKNHIAVRGHHSYFNKSSAGGSDIPHS